MSNDWKNVRLKNYSQILLSNIDKKSYDGENAVLLCNYTDVYKNKKIHKHINFMPATASKAQIGKLTLRYKDVIITKDSESADDIGIPSVVEHTAPNLVCGYHLAIIRSKKLNGDFISYLFQSKVAKDYFLEVCLGFTRVSLNKGDILNFKFNMPSLPQQTAIAKYLDLHTTKLDKEISLLEQKVAMLEEYKQALIYETVTKGLDKSVPLKDSGVEWIGLIPQHWEVKRVKDLFDLKKGKNAGDYSKEYILDDVNKGEYPVYSGQTENSGIMGCIDTFEYDFHKGTLFTTTVGAKAMTVTKLFGKFSLSQNCGLLISKKKSNINWNYYMILNCFEFTKQNIPSYMQPSLRKEDLSNIFCFNVPYLEQQQIAEYLDEQCSTIDKKKELIHKKIALLKEYKQSLIYEAVTGKLNIGA